MKHRSGISIATMYYRTDTLQPYQSVVMLQGFNPVYWLADIPAQPVGTTIYYYLEAQSVSGKQQVRPMPAPAGYWKFTVLGSTGLSQNYGLPELLPVFPNPSKGITCIPVNTATKIFISINLKDLLGKQIASIFSGHPYAEENRYFIDTQLIPEGLYIIEMESDAGISRQKLIIR